MAPAAIVHCRHRLLYVAIRRVLDGIYPAPAARSYGQYRFAEDLRRDGGALRRGHQQSWLARLAMRCHISAVPLLRALIIV